LSDMRVYLVTDDRAERFELGSEGTGFHHLFSEMPKELPDAGILSTALYCSMRMHGRWSRRAINRKTSMEIARRIKRWAKARAVYLVLDAEVSKEDLETIPLTGSLSLAGFLEE